MGTAAITDRPRRSTAPTIPMRPELYRAARALAAKRETNYAQLVRGLLRREIEAEGIPIDDVQASAS